MPWGTMEPGLLQSIGPEELATPEKGENPGATWGRPLCDVGLIPPTAE